MSNLYKPPESDLDIEGTGNNRPYIFWRIFFWINIAISPLILIVISSVEDINFLDYIDLIFFAFIIAVLYLYSYGKKLKYAWLWKTLSFLYPVWYLFYEIIGPLTIDMTHYGEPAVVDNFIIISILFFIPSTYALYAYAFKTNTSS